MNYKDPARGAQLKRRACRLIKEGKKRLQANPCDMPVDESFELHFWGGPDGDDKWDDEKEDEYDGEDDWDSDYEWTPEDPNQDMGEFEWTESYEVDGCSDDEENVDEEDTYIRRPDELNQMRPYFGFTYPSVVEDSDLIFSPQKKSKNLCWVMKATSIVWNKEYST